MHIRVCVLGYVKILNKNGLVKNKTKIKWKLFQ